MATHSGWKSNRASMEKSTSQARVGDPESGARLPIVWRNSNPPIAVSDRLTHTVKPSGRRGRRIISREQGCALEMIGHAVDYLNDQYLLQGPDDEVLSFESPAMEAVWILIASQRELLRSLPVAEPLRRRAWNALLHRKKRAESLSVVPLSSSGR